MEGLRSLLDEVDGLRVVAAETSLIDAMDAVRELRPSLVLLDKGLGTHAVIDWLIMLQRFQPPPAIMVWGTALSDSEALRFLQAGATGLARKTSSLDSMVSCMRTVVGGGIWMENDILREADRQTHSDRSTLTAREQQVLELVQQGMRNREVALALGICVGTVKIHLKHIFEKTGVRGRWGLAVSGLKEKGLPAALVV
jgi:DNA-binding NarL/FixJ family response regulator